MKYRKPLVYFLVMALCLYGCGNKDIEDNNEYRLDCFSFSVPEWLSQGKHSKSESDDKIYNYEFVDSNSSVRLAVGDMYNNTKPEAFMDNESIINGFPWDYIEDCPYTSAQTPIRACLKSLLRTSFRQILPITALKILAIRQYACGFLPCPRQNYARKSVHKKNLNRLLAV